MDVVVDINRSCCGSESNGSKTASHIWLSGRSFGLGSGGQAAVAAAAVAAVDVTAVVKRRYCEWSLLMFLSLPRM